MGKKMLRTVVTGAAGTLCFLVLKESEAVAEGIRRGLLLCVESVIPSLFLFMILAEFLSAADISPALFWPVRLVCWLFRLPEETAPVIAVSMTGGYPAGAKMVGDLVKRGRLSPRTGEKILCSCVCCSPAFLAGAVGTGLFGDVRLGFLMAGCQTAAMLCTGIAAGFLMPCDRAEKDLWSGERDYAACFVKAVTGAGKAVLTVSLFVTVFSAAQMLLRPLPGWEVMSGLLEVSVGCASLGGEPFRKALILSTVYTSLGGGCVWMQLYCFLGESGVRMRKFLPFRMLHCFLSLVFTLTAVKILDLPQEVFSTFSEPLVSNGSSSVTAGACLVMLCLMLLMTLPRRQKSCVSRKSVV